MALQDEIGIAPEDLGKAMRRLTERDGENPLFAMERGEITEDAFLESSPTASSRSSATAPHAPLPRALSRPSHRTSR